MGAQDIVRFKFKKGQSGNPNGSRAAGERRKAFKNLSNDCLDRIASHLFYGTEAEFKRLAQADDVTPAELLVIAVVNRVMRTGDPRCFKVIMDRFLGPPRYADETEAETSESSKSDERDLMKMSRAELIRESLVYLKLDVENLKHPPHVREAYKTIYDFELAEAENFEAQDTLQSD